jgi:hypothetical protein
MEIIGGFLAGCRRKGSGQRQKRRNDPHTEGRRKECSREKKARGGCNTYQYQCIDSLAFALPET